MIIDDLELWELSIVTELTKSPVTDGLTFSLIASRVKDTMNQINTRTINSRWWCIYNLQADFDIRNWKKMQLFIFRLRIVVSGCL